MAEEENVYSMVNNPVYASNTSGSTQKAPIDSVKPSSSCSKTTLILAVALSFNILLTVCSLSIALFLLANRNIVVEATLDNGGRSDLLQDEQKISDLEDVKSALIILTRDMNITRSQIKVLMDNADVAQTQFQSIALDMNTTESRVKMLVANVEDLNVRQSSISEAVLVINGTASMGLPGNVLTVYNKDDVASCFLDQ